MAPHQIILLSCLKPSYCFSWLRIESDLTRTHRALDWPASAYVPASSLAARFTRTQLLSFLPLKCRLVPDSSCFHLGSPLCFEHIPSCFPMSDYSASFRFWSRYTSSKVAFLSLKILHAPVIFSIYPTPELYLLYNPESPLKCYHFWHCLLVSMLPSPSRRTVPWEFAYVYLAPKMFSANK